MSNKVFCHDCGLQYGGDAWIEAVVPDQIWDQIRPTGSSKGCGILCVSCIARRLRILGMKDVPVWFCGTEPLIAVGGDPSDRLDLLRG